MTTKVSIFALVLAFATGCHGSSPSEPTKDDTGGAMTDGDAAAQRDSSVMEPDANTSPDSGQPIQTDAAIGMPSADGGAAVGDSSTTGNLLADVRKKLDQCGILSASRNVDIGMIVDEFDRCTAACVVEAQCVDVRSAYCVNSSPTAMGPVIDCSEKCSLEPADGFKCADGSRIPHAFVCDLNKDCSGGDDEKNCGTFTCDDDERLASREVKCDGVIDCGDESDESGCPLPACSK